jgi:hypothetical protein
MLLVLVARASAAPARVYLSLGLACVTAAALPVKLWWPQLQRLGKLVLFLFVFTAIGAGMSHDSVRQCAFGGFPNAILIHIL